MKDIYKEYNLFIDSRCRTYGTSNVHYRVDFNGEFFKETDYGIIECPNASISHGAFKNVVSIELVGASIQNVPNESYVILDIDECENRLESNQNLADQAFAILYYDRVTDVGDLYTKPIKGSDMNRKIIEYSPPLSSLSRLHIHFKSHVIEPVSNLPYMIAHDADYYNTLLFKITTKINTNY